MQKRSVKAILCVLVLGIVLGSVQGVSSAYNIAPNSARAIIVADNLLAWQTESGGWDKNQDFSVVMWKPGMAKSSKMSGGIERGTFDNNASLDEMRFLAKVYQSQGGEQYKEGFMRGLDWMLKAQYPSGGWPQFYPLLNGYWDNVTYNDNAMPRVLNFIAEILQYQDSIYNFIPAEYFDRLETAREKGLEFILISQIEVNGKLTAWCQQHDPVTYEPRMGRAYEHPSIVSAESVSVVRYLMSLPEPSDEIKIAILSALEWFEISRLKDGRWARFYEMGTNVPIFSGRDSIVRYFVNDIETERQNGYSWYNNSPRSLLDSVNSSGYLEQLRAEFPDHVAISADDFDDPAVVKFHNPTAWPRKTVKEDLDVYVKIFMREIENFEEIVLKLDGEEIYRGNEVDAKVTVAFDELYHGHHILVAETKTTKGVSFTHMVDFMVVK